MGARPVKYLEVKMATDILTPVGRIVQGHPMVEQTTGYGGKPMTTKDGRPRSAWFFALAIPKTDPGWPAVWNAIDAEARAGFPGGEFNRQDFSWKVLNGDAPENSEKVGFAGCWVLRISGGFPPKCWQKGGTAQIVDKEQIKCGYYARAYVNVAPNGDKGKPGVYINPSLVELVGYGEEIVGGPDGAKVFGEAAPAALPPGASETPVAGAPLSTGPGPGTTPGPGAAAGGPAMGPPGGTSGPGPGPGAGGPPGPGTPEPAPDFLKPPIKQMTMKAQGYTYEQFIQQGWNDQQLIDQGYMVLEPQDVPM
jgi:hypothetical protein